MPRTLNRAGWVLAGVLALLLVAALAGVVRGGPLDPPGSPGPTDATQITALPFTITTSGTYVLRKNLTGVSGQNGISVNADNVTIDLNGFALIGPSGGGSETAIQLGSPGNLVVRNGSVLNWRCGGISAGNSTGGAFDDLRLSGNGAGCANSAALEIGAADVANCDVFSNSYNGLRITTGAVTRCTATGNGQTGIVLNGAGAVVRDCASSGNLSGISAASGGSVSGCAVSANLGVGITGTRVVISDNSVTGNGTAGASPGIDVMGRGIVSGNTVSGSTGDGIRVANSGSFVTRNTLDGNANSGVYVNGTGVSNRIDGNNVYGGMWGIYIDGNDNSIVGNSVGLVSQLRFFIGGVSNAVGPQQGSNGTALANPWANIVQ